MLVNVSFGVSQPRFYPGCLNWLRKLSSPRVLKKNSNIGSVVLIIVKSEDRHTVHYDHVLKLEIDCQGHEIHTVRRNTYVQNEVNTTINAGRMS